MKTEHTYEKYDAKNDCNRYSIKYVYACRHMLVVIAKNESKRANKFSYYVFPKYLVRSPQPTQLSSPVSLSSGPRRRCKLRYAAFGLCGCHSVGISWQHCRYIDVTPGFQMGVESRP